MCYGRSIVVVRQAGGQFLTDVNKKVKPPLDGNIPYDIFVVIVTKLTICKYPKGHRSQSYTQPKPKVEVSIIEKMF